jgi:hypothetical protein
MDTQYKNFLTATIKVPVKINANGELVMLDNYAEISVEPLTNEPIETFDSIYERIIEYVHRNPGYLTSIIQENEGNENEGTDEEDKIIVLKESPLHTFSFKKSKKPLNTTFRNKGTKHNFTKKNYE